MEYEELLTQAYEKVEPVSECCRFEVLKVKGHHEGSRTIVTNFSQIVSCVRRPSWHLMKFLSKELASSAEVSGDRLILSRRLSSKDINERIGRYVNRFVICSKCGKPDTEMTLLECNALIKCMACGAKQEVHRI